MFCVFRSLLIFSFSFICFSSRFLFDFSRSPSQHASLFEVSSLPLYFLLLFIIFPSVLFFCLLLFSRFFHLFSLFKLPFFCFFSISMFLYVKLFMEKFFKLLRNYFSSFHHKKTSFSLFPFLLGFFFPCLVFFCVLKMVSRFITRLFFDSSFQLCFSFSPFLMYPKNKNVFFVLKCGKNSLLFSVSVLLV